MLGRVAAAAINHLLAPQPWALARLQAFAGKTAEFDIPPFRVRLAVLDDGQVASSDRESDSDAMLRMTPPVAARFLMGDEGVRSQVEITGDAEFVREIAYLAQYLPWDVEEDLSRVLGDVVAYRAVSTARGLAQWGRQSAENVTQSIQEYLTEEQPVIAKTTQVEKFIRDVDDVRDAVARLEKRLEKLSAQINSHQGRAAGQ